jgi:hypothetical protein
MPAIDIARLKIQAATLVEQFDQPAVFVRELHEILDLYADRTMRMGVVASPVSVLPAYRTPQSVLKQIEMELLPLAATFPEQAMTLTEGLWRDGYLETRLLAASLLGRIHPQTPQLLERITSWVSHSRDASLRSALLSTGLNRLRRETPERFLSLLQDWFAASNLRMWPNAIQALIPLLRDREYQNMPPVFDILEPVLQNAPTSLQVELTTLLNELFAASPVETAYFLKKTIFSKRIPGTVLLFRRMLPGLDAKLQSLVREWLRETKPS